MNQLIGFVQETIHRHDKSIRQFAKDIGLSHGYLNNILNDKQKAGRKFFERFSDFTHVTIDSLVALQDASLDDPPVDIQYREDWLTDHQKELLKYFRALPADEQDRILAEIRRLRNQLGE